MRGRGKILDALKGAHNWIKTHKVISSGANFLGRAVPGTAGSVFRAVGTAAGSLGYGGGRRRRYVRGMGLRLAGGGTY